MGKTVSLPQIGGTPPKRWRALLGARWARLAMFAALVTLLMYQGQQQARWRADDPVRLDEAAGLFPDAARVVVSEELGGGFDVLSPDGELLGRLARTMPEAAGVVGYRGPTDALLAFRPDGEIVGMRLRRSADTPDHLRDVAADREFMASFTGWRLHELADYDNALALEAADIWPVSGATLTSSAVIDGVIARAKAQEQLDAPRPAVRLGRQDYAIGLWVLGGLALMFTKLRKRRRLRAGFRVLAVVWHLGLGGGLIALSLITGWAMHGPAWRTAPALTALVVLMFGLPILLGKNAYCQELCPHGILQGWLRHLPGIRPAAVPRPVRAGLRWLAPGLVGIALIVVLLDLPRDLAGFEPFDTYPLWRSGGWAWGATLAVFAVGLLVSVRYPMAYCQHACPTGWLLRAAGGRRGTHRLAQTDLWLLALVLIIAGVVWADHRAWFVAHPVDRTPTLLTPLELDDAPAIPDDTLGRHTAPPVLLVLDGETMLTTWRVVLYPGRTQRIDPDTLGRHIADTLARIESAGSVWHTGSDPDRLNRAAPGEWVELRPESLVLFATAQTVQRQSGGAFDPTLGHISAAVGLGPTPPHHAEASVPTAPPGPAWELDAARCRARKLHGAIAFDLGGVLQGGAADLLATRLIDAGLAGGLVEVGGEVRAFGQAPPGGWRVRSQSPGGAAETLTLASGQALATSDTRATTRAGHSHLIDPDTDTPQTTHCRVTVRAQRAALADAWATALAAAGPDRARALIASHQLEARYEWTDPDGQHVYDRLPEP